MPKFSVIVPVYKAEDVLPRCIESILNQTVPDFELILIDDGSPDRSGAICDEYAAKDARIHVIHQENGGVSKARNAGLDAVQGEFVVFVDSDDHISTDHLEELDEDHIDLIVSGMIVNEPDGSVRTILTEPEEIKTILTQENRIECLKKLYSRQVLGKRFSKALIDTHNLRFDEDLSFGEDTIFMAEYILLIRNVKTKPGATYHYSTANAASLSKRGNNFFEAYCEIQIRLIDLFSTHAHLKKYIIDKLYWLIESELVRISRSAMTNAEKNCSIKAILHAPYMQKCLKLYEDRIPVLLKIAYRIKSTVLIKCLYRMN